MPLSQNGNIIYHDAGDGGDDDDDDGDDDGDDDDDDEPDDYDDAGDFDNGTRATISVDRCVRRDRPRFAHRGVSSAIIVF